MEKKTPYAPNNLTERPKAYYMDLFKDADPAEIAERTGCGLDGQTLVFTVLGNMMRMNWPEFDNEGWSDKDRILLLHYALEGRHVEPTDEYASYKELPNGALYNGPFTGRCIMRMIGMFGKNIEGFKKVCTLLGGSQIQGSGVTYEFEFMENLKVRFTIWEGDDEFPASGQILFSKNFAESFAAEDRVVVCEHILGRMKAELSR